MGGNGAGLQKCLCLLPCTCEKRLSWEQQAQHQQQVFKHQQAEPSQTHTHVRVHTGVRDHAKQTAAFGLCFRREATEVFQGSFHVSVWALQRCRRDREPTCAAVCLPLALSRGQGYSVPLARSPLVILSHLCPFLKPTCLSLSPRPILPPPFLTTPPPSTVSSPLPTPKRRCHPRPTLGQRVGVGLPMPSRATCRRPQTATVPLPTSVALAAALGKWRHQHPTSPTVAPLTRRRAENTLFLLPAITQPQLHICSQNKQERLPKPQAPSLVGSQGTRGGAAAFPRASRLVAAVDESYASHPRALGAAGDGYLAFHPGGPEARRALWGAGAPLWQHQGANLPRATCSQQAPTRGLHPASLCTPLRKSEAGGRLSPLLACRQTLGWALPWWTHRSLSAKSICLLKQGGPHSESLAPPALEAE